MTDLLARPFVLVLLSALGYAAATLALKAASTAPAFGLIVVLGLCLALACGAELILMRKLDLGVLYLLIIGTETLIVLTAAYLIGEGLAPRDWLGAALILAGAAAVSH